MNFYQPRVAEKEGSYSRHTPDGLSATFHLSGVPVIPRKRTTIEGWLVSAMLLLWLTAVAVLSANHVPWRDEVRALSLAVNATSPQGLLRNLQGEGHPVLWYVLLNFAYHIYSSPIVLKLVSVIVAFLANVIFLFRAPFPVWFRALFMFCGLPSFEYSVVARNYGISMLLLFVFAWCYTSKRRNLVLLGLIFFLLANTNVASVGFVVLLLAISISDGLNQWSGTKNTSSGLAVATGIGLALSGILLCVCTVVPHTTDNIYITQQKRPGLYVLSDSVKHAGWQFRALTGADFMFAKFAPGAKKHFAIQLLTYLVLLLGIVGLAQWPLLAFAALSSMWGLSLFFTTVYPGFYRHQGLWLIFLLTLYWLAEARSDPPSWTRFTGLRRMSLYVVLPLLLLINCVRGAHAAIEDCRRPASSSRQLGTLLNSRDDLKQAVVVSAPDLMLEALPYYLHNRLYLMGLSQYGNVSSSSRHQKLKMSLGDILFTVHRLQFQTGSPIVILLHPSLDRPHADNHYSYGFGFSWTEAELAELHHETIHLASLRGASTDENYDVYLVKQLLP